MEAPSGSKRFQERVYDPPLSIRSRAVELYLGGETDTNKGTENAGVLETMAEEGDEEYDGEEDGNIDREAADIEYGDEHSEEEGGDEDEEEGNEEEGVDEGGDEVGEGGEVVSGESEEVETIEPAELSPPTKVPRPSKHKRQRKLVSLLLSKYDSVWEAAENMGWQTFGADREEGSGGKYDICWSDTSVSLERVMCLGRSQKINHFPVREG